MLDIIELVYPVYSVCFVYSVQIPLFPSFAKGDERGISCL
jgi:hypothetical protein